MCGGPVCHARSHGGSQHAVAVSLVTLLDAKLQRRNWPCIAGGTGEQAPALGLTPAKHIVLGLSQPISAAVQEIQF